MRVLAALLLSTTVLTTTLSNEIQSISPVPVNREASVQEILAEYGQPAFALGTLLVYRSTLAGLEADVSFFILNGVLSEITYAFDPNPNRLRESSDRVLKNLTVSYGPPSTTLRDQSFRTDRWEDETGELIHTVVYTEGQEQHSIRATRTRSSASTETGR